MGDKSFIGDGVKLIRNDRNMSVGLIYDNCTTQVADRQRHDIWRSDLFLKSAFKKSVDKFRTGYPGKLVKTAAFKFIAVDDAIKFEPISSSFNMSSHDYYQSLK